MRVIKANGLDLDLFQFDYDQTWCVMFLNADRTIYGRYGTRAGGRKNADTHISVAGFKKSMERALQTHKGFPDNKKVLQGYTGPKAAFATPDKIPDQSKGGNRCIHCHEAHDRLLRHQWQNKTLTAEDFWVYPLPENIGLKMDVEDCLSVKNVTVNSPADKAGIAAGDRVLRINGLPLLSQADIQWVLHRAPTTTKLDVQLERDRKKLSKTVALEGSWKEGDLSWRESSWHGLRGALRLVDLSAAERKKQGVAEGVTAFRVKDMYAPAEPLRKAGLKIGDVILGVGGREDLLTETTLLVHIRLTYPPGSRIKLGLLRDGKKMELTIPAW